MIIKRNFHKLVYCSVLVSFSVLVSCCTNDIDLLPGNTVTLTKSAADQLCVIFRLSDDGKITASVGRSYVGRDWESVAGPFPSLLYNCATDCTVTLPPLAVGETFSLSTFSRELSKENELSRFLEQATFGPTKEGLASFDTGISAKENIKLWVYDQMFNVNITSHREYFRTRANSRSKPTHIGAPYHACEAGTKFRKTAFASTDLWRFLHIKQVNDKFALYISNELRSVVDSIEWSSDDTIATYGNLDTTDHGYFICGIMQYYLGMAVSITDPTSKKCLSLKINGVIGSPAVSFPTGNYPQPKKVITIPDSSLKVINQQYFPTDWTPDIPNVYGNEQEFQLLEDLDDTLCLDISAEFDGVPIFVFRETTQDYLAHDPPLKLLTNTLENPAMDGGAEHMAYANDYLTETGDELVQCSNVRRNFINEEYCKLSPNVTTCSFEITPSITVNLDDETIKTFYNVTLHESTLETRYVYAVDNLEIDENSKTLAPCQAIVQSRWIPLPDGTTCTNDLHALTKTHLGNLLAASTDENMYLRDIINENANGCHTADAQKKGYMIEVTVDGVVTCWQHVHQQHLQVFDMTYWTYDDTHPGNSASRNPIKEFAENGDAILTFPSWHTMDRWTENSPFFTEVGRYGDNINYAKLPSSIRSEAVVQAFNATTTSLYGAGVVVCGSPYEVANDIELGGGNNYGAFDMMSRTNRTNAAFDYRKSKYTVWTMVSLFADDQLRQKMAWVLSKILTIAAPSDTNPGVAEMWSTTYDIFVRHAFGNYFNLLKEMAYNQMMSVNLSYLNSRSTYSIWRSFGTVAYPDENFAREIMQLYSIGLCKLNMDGSQVMDGDSCVHTYSNDDIVEYARVWTGFVRDARRGNIETERPSNYIDPLVIREDYRDFFPKMGLDGRYIGEGYPLCTQRPKKHFLKIGAKYLLLGSSANPEQHSDPEQWASDVNAVRVVLEKPNPRWGTVDKFLYTHLCNADEFGVCQFRATFTIEDDNLKCIGIECKLDTVKVVEVDGMFYEYIQAPCVEQAFFPRATLTSSRIFTSQQICADPRRELASNACCENQNPTQISHARATEFYWGERMTFRTASERCNVLGQPVCPMGKVVARHCRDENGNAMAHCSNNGQYWQKQRCQLKVKIDAATGNVAIVHGGMNDDQMLQWVREESITYFRVHWRNGNYPQPGSMCGRSPSCVLHQNDNCLCEVSIREIKLFATMPTREDVIEKATYGAYNPELLRFVLINELNGVKHYAKSSLRPFHRTSIFEVTDDFGVKRFYQNLRSVVGVGKGRGRMKYSFRNPVHFSSLIVQDKRDMHYETHAALEHYFYHKNTSPFISKLLIQHFGISNPSPRFIQTVATAFHSGSFVHDDLEFGLGKYGDLSATLAAILLDSESREVVLDKDPTHGSFHEALMKVMRFMRSMEIRPDETKPFIELEKIESDIGQMIYTMSSVFSYYLPEYAPQGSISSAQLVAPESQLNVGPNVIGLLNGLYSLIKYGINDKWSGFFRGKGGIASRDPGDFSYANGVIDYTPSSTDAQGIVEELDTLLTSGRLSNENKQVLIDVYNNEADKTAALMMVQQLLVSSPEYHTTGLTSRSGEVRPQQVAPTPPTKPYKAVVYLFMTGGMDSFNMVVPRCDPLKSQYENKRRELALTDSQLLPITLKNGQSQPCTEFAVHKKLSELQRSFNEDETLFLANIGVLNTAVDVTNYRSSTKTQLFAHNTMQKECQRIDPYIIAPTTGVMGRMIDELNQKTESGNKMYRTSTISIKSTSVALSGKAGVSDPQTVVPQGGVLEFDPYPWSRRPTWANVDLYPSIQELNGAGTTESSFYGETWSSDLLRVIDNSELVGDAMENVALQNRFPTDHYGQQISQVARLIASKDTRGVDREVFFVEFSGWDHHAELLLNLNEKFFSLNAALAAFWAEMKSQGLEDNVVLVGLSEFSRTLTPNSSDGSDHAWGGQAFVSGGNVKGGRMLGKFPADLDGELNIDGSAGRGRLIPTTSFDAMFNGIVQWMGIEEEEALNRVLPNRLTCGSELLNKSDMFMD